MKANFSGRELFTFTVKVGGQVIDSQEISLEQVLDESTNGLVLDPVASFNALDTESQKNCLDDISNMIFEDIDLEFSFEKTCPLMTDADAGGNE